MKCASLVDLHIEYGVIAGIRGYREQFLLPALVARIATFATLDTSGQPQRKTATVVDPHTITPDPDNLQTVIGVVGIGILRRYPGNGRDREY